MQSKGICFSLGTEWRIFCLLDECVNRYTAKPYIHGGVDLSHGFVVSGELVDLHSVADQLTGDFNFELGQLALGDGVRLGDDWDNIDLQLRNEASFDVTVTITQEGADKYFRYAAKYRAGNSFAASPLL